jgi:hypothetical protein
MRFGHKTDLTVKSGTKNAGPGIAHRPHNRLRAFSRLPVGCSTRRSDVFAVIMSIMIVSLKMSKRLARLQPTVA